MVNLPLKRSNTMSKPSLFGWIKVLKNVEDDDLRTICGTDGALYLIFLRYAAMFFCAVTVTSLAIVIPLYLSGDPLPEDDAGIQHHISFLSRINILNISASFGKAATIFSIMFLLYTTLTLSLVFFYWKKSMEWRYKQHSHLDNF